MCVFVCVCVCVYLGASLAYVTVPYSRIFPHAMPTFRNMFPHNYNL